MANLHNEQDDPLPQGAIVTIVLQDAKRVSGWMHQHFLPSGTQVTIVGVEVRTTKQGDILHYILMFGNRLFYGCLPGVHFTR